MRKLATLPNPVYPEALLVELSFAGALEAWASPAMIEEDQEVLSRHPELLQHLLAQLELCCPLTEIEVIRRAQYSTLNSAPAKLLWVRTQRAAYILQQGFNQ